MFIKCANISPALSAILVICCFVVFTAGASIEVSCRAGYYCEGVTGEPPICPGGYYCPLATSAPSL